jgi:Zn-dependent peptidase ImmA (M78 family)
MRSLARRIRNRQDAAAELYEVLEEEPPWPNIALDYDEDPERLAERTRPALGISLDEQFSWRDSAGYAPLREWTDAIESLGVLVAQNGELPVEFMRGFASTHAVVPAVVVNTQDDPRARAFTAVHELGHLIRARAGRATGRELERWCDVFAAQLLMPPDTFVPDFEHEAHDDLLAKVDALALRYGVTPLAAAVRVARLRLAPQPEAGEVIEHIRERGRAREAAGGGGGGNYYWTTIGRLSPAYIQLVFAALDTQAVTYPAASGLLDGVKVNNFAKLREHLDQRLTRV